VLPRDFEIQVAQEAERRRGLHSRSTESERSLLRGFRVVCS
jgi:hypothetical protein